MRIIDNITNKTSYKCKGLLVTHVKARDHVHSPKTKPLHQQFGENGGNNGEIDGKRHLIGCVYLG